MLIDNNNEGKEQEFDKEVFIQAIKSGQFELLKVDDAANLFSFEYTTEVIVKKRGNINEIEITLEPQVLPNSQWQNTVLTLVKDLTLACNNVTRGKGNVLELSEMVEELGGQKLPAVFGPNLSWFHIINTNQKMAGQLNEKVLNIAPAEKVEVWAENTFYVQCVLNPYKYDRKELTDRINKLSDYFSQYL